MSRVYETAIKIGATVTKAFKGDALAAAAGLTKLSGAAKQLKIAEKAAASVGKLNDAIASSREKYNVSSEALRRLKESEEAAGKATKESTRWRKEGEKEVAKYARELDQATKAAEKNAKKLKDIELLRFEASREKIFGARKDGGPLTDKAGAQFRGIASDVAFLGAAAGGAATAMGALVLHTIKTGDEIGDTADKLGISAKALQELRYGAAQSGAEVGSLDKALAKMAINVGKHKMAKGKAGAGGGIIPGLQMLDTSNPTSAGAVVDPFKQIGLNAKELSKLKPEEQFKKIADGLAKLKTHADRAAVGSMIFGKGISDILPFIEEGDAGIEKLSKDAHKYGGVLTDEQIKNADLADKAWRDMNMAVTGFTTTLSADLMPVATKVFKEVAAWVAKNRAQIKQWSETAAKWIETKGIPAFKHIVKEVQKFGTKVLWLVEGAAKLTGGFGNLAIAVAAIRVAPLAVSLGQIAANGYKAVAALVRYAAAAKAAKAAGATPAGMDFTASGTAFGAAANLALVAGAAALGYAIGTFIDEKLGLSNKIANGVYNKFSAAEDKKTEDAGVAAHKAKLELEQLKRRQRIIDLTKKGLSLGQATYAADHPDAPLPAPRVAGASGGVLAPVIHIHGHPTRDQIAKGMDKAKHHLLNDHDKREAHRKRVAYAG